MKKWTKSVLVTVLSAVFLLGCMGTAWATSIGRDTNSNFAISGDTADSDVTSFNLIKDYDSVNPTGSTAPKSESPEETVTYTFKPYGVWNAGHTYSGSGTGTATKIDKTNMPMGFNGTGGSAVSGSGASRTWSITSNLDLGDAKVPATPDDYVSTDKKTEIKLPAYTTVGDYWYEVKETIGVGGNPTTGVLYGTNDAQTENLANANGDHNATYYIHVQVTEKTPDTPSGTPDLVSNVTLHKTAPTAGTTDAVYNAAQSTTYAASDKINAIENKYYAGDLVIIKIVTGNAGDKSEYFPVTVVFTKTSGTIVNSDITFNAALHSTDSDGKDVYTDTNCTIWGQHDTTHTGLTDAQNVLWKIGGTKASATNTAEATATAVFYVKDNSTVTFSNIPYGITYTVQEALPANDNYKNKLEFTSSSNDIGITFDGITLAADADADYAVMSTDDTKKATGGISDPTDEITITNQKNVTIDIGVITENAPFIALIAVSGAVLFLLVSRKKKLSEV